LSGSETIARGWGWRKTSFCLISHTLHPGFWKVWGVWDIRTSRRTKVSSRKQGMNPGTLDEENSTLVSEVKNRPLKYLIAFPYGLQLGEMDQAQETGGENPEGCVIYIHI
jgi:hypothetical protein